MQSSNISFKSRIKFVDYNTFLRQTIMFPAENMVGGKFVAEDMVKANKAYTSDVRTCTAGGILTKNPNCDAFDVVMFHLCPPEENTPENFDISKIEKNIVEKLAGSKPLQGIILGSKKAIDYSPKFFDKIEQIFKKLEIPYSKFKGQADASSTDMAYDGAKDEWLITSSNGGFFAKQKQSAFKSGFEEVSICPKDELISRFGL